MVAVSREQQSSRDLCDPFAEDSSMASLQSGQIYFVIGPSDANNETDLARAIWHVAPAHVVC